MLIKSFVWIGGDILKLKKIKPKVKSEIIGLIVRIMLMLPVIYIILYPLFTMISTSLMSQYQVMDPSVVWIPKVITFDNFNKALLALDYKKSMLQTLYVNVLSALIEVLVCSVTAYGFARFKFKFKNLLLGILLLNIIVPTEMISIPTFLQLRKADVLGILNLIGTLIGKDIRPNLINTPWSFWIPSLLSVGLRSGLFIFIYMQFFRGLPNELEEAAYIDGAGPLRTFVKIIVPSSGAAFLTVTIFSLIWHWNDYYLSALYFSNTFSLAVKLSKIDQSITTIKEITGTFSTRNGIIMAASLLFILPMLIVYLILQRKFIKSVDRVGIVG